MTNQQIDCFIYVAVIVLFGIACFTWFIAGFIQWRDEEGRKNGFWCYHQLTDDNGGMGDAIKCDKCGLFTYDSFNSHLWIFRMLGRVSPSDKCDKPEEGESSIW